MEPQPEVDQMSRTRNFLPVFLALCVLASVSCGGGTDSGTPPPPPTSRCDLASQEDEQRAYERDEYFPKIYSRDFSRDLGADISPTDDDYDLARKVSRSVFDVELRGGRNPVRGTGWLIAPRYVATAAHNVTEQIGPVGQGRCEKTDHTVHVHTFDGDTIGAEVVWFDEKCVARTDLALLRLEREIDAIPMKIADRRPGRNEMLMAMGGSGNANGLGSWNVTAGPALELRSGRTGHPSGPSRLPGRVYQWVPTGAGGMSGGPIFNRRGEVVSIVSTSGFDGNNTADIFGVRNFQKPDSPPENLWVYGFIQRSPSHFSIGPNPGELRELYNKDPGLSEPANAGDYRNSNKWERTDHPLGDHYSPFPIDQFDRMNGVYKEARKGTVTVRAGRFNGSGFIYDDSTVITVAHVARELGEGADIRTIDGRSHRATVSKTQDGNDCDIAILKTEEPGALSGYTKLELGDSSSLRCGDPLVQIGSGGAYNAAGELQGLGAVYMTTEEYTSNLLSRSAIGGMSGGPVVDRDGRVVAISSEGQADLRDEWDRPAPLYIHTRFPVYFRQDKFVGQNPETIRKFIEQSDFYCPPIELRGTPSTK